MLREELERWSARARLEAEGRVLYASFDPIAASVLPMPDLNPKGHSILIDRGRRHGVRVGHGVVSSQGLVGRVTKCWERYAWVRRVDDPRFRVMAQALDEHGTSVSSGRLVVAGSGTEGFLVPLLAERVDPLKEGLSVVTSGAGGVFPPKIVVGTVAEVRLPYSESRIEGVAKVSPGDGVIVLATPGSVRETTH